MLPAGSAVDGSCRPFSWPIMNTAAAQAYCGMGLELALAQWHPPKSPDLGKWTDKLISLAHMSKWPFPSFRHHLIA
jgi:hypothetical protein